MYKPTISPITIQAGGPTEVSYTILTVNHLNSIDILEKVATAINVQLTLEEGQNFPFIPFISFDKAKNEDKLFIIGPSGCGKSKGIFEIIKNKLENYENIYIINPRTLIGNKSGRISIIELISKVNQKDVIIWDNFPDDLAKKDIALKRCLK
jgi:ABC-type transport system involved in cytochrome bd biosynthesis fused ATPase/permease subunit